MVGDFEKKNNKNKQQQQQNPKQNKKNSFSGEKSQVGDGSPNSLVSNDF